MEPHSTFWGSWPSAPPYWAILEKVHERKNLPRQRRKSISSCVWSRGHNNLIKILRTINDMRVCIVCFWLRALTIEVQEMTSLSKITNLKHISCHVWQEIIRLYLVWKDCIKSYHDWHEWIQSYQISSWLTLIGMREGTFHPLVFFGSDFVSWVFNQNFPNLFGGENWHQSS